jgi:DNA-binding winged helix-turn-helix (wHTH) protein
MNDLSTECLEFSFGPFRLIPEQQLLVEGEKPVNLGARGLELLHALVEHSGEVVSKDELIARIWPDTCVSKNNLKVQIAALRRALGEGPSWRSLHSDRQWSRLPFRRPGRAT